MRKALFAGFFVLVLAMAAFGFWKIRQMMQEKKEEMLGDKNDEARTEYIGKAKELLNQIEAAAPLVDDQCERIEQALNDGVSFEELMEDTEFAEAQKMICEKRDGFQKQFGTLSDSCPPKMTPVDSAVSDCCRYYAEWVSITENPSDSKYVFSNSRNMMKHQFEAMLDMARTVIRNQESMLNFKDRQKDLLH